MIEALIPMVVCTSMFAMIFGIAYLKSRENMALIEKGINPKQNTYRPKPFVNLKWGLLLIGCGLGLLSAYIIDSMLPNKPKVVTKKHIVVNPADSTRKDTINTGKHVIVIKDGKDDKKVENIETLEDLDTDITINDSHHKGSKEININAGDSDNPAIYFALIAIGGGLGLFFSYRIEKKEWLDKNKGDIKVSNIDA